MTILLEEHHILSFQQEGLIYLPQFLSKTELGELNEIVDRLQELSPTITPPLMYYSTSLKDQDKQIPLKLECFLDYYPAFRELINNTKINSIIGTLFKDEASLFEDKLVFNIEGTTGFGAHQDYTWFGWELFAKKYIVAHLAIDEATIENGCTEFSLNQHLKGKVGSTWRKDDLNSYTYTPYPMAPGDLIIYDAFLPHRSKPNLSRKRRCSLYLAFNRISEGDLRAKYFHYKPKITRHFLINRIKNILKPNL